MSTTPGGEPPPDDRDVPDEPASPYEAPPPEPPAQPEPPVPPAQPEPPVPPVSPEPPAQPGYGAPPPQPGHGAPPQPNYGPPPPPGYAPPPAQPGYAPPPPPGYGPPPGGYPPPGYGPPPGGYPPPGYGAPSRQPSLFGAALSDGWNAFTKVGGVFVGAAVVWFVIAVAVLSVVSLIFGGWGRIVDQTRGLRDYTAPGFSFRNIVLSVAAALVFALIQAVFVRVALAVTRGARPAFGDFFRFADVGPIVVLALLIAAIDLVVGFVAWIPVIGWLIQAAVQLFLLFAYYVLLDRRVQPVDAVRGSVQLVSRSFGQTLVFFILAGLIAFAGLIACGVGIFATVPIAGLATAYLYRRLTGEQPQLPA